MFAIIALVLFLVAFVLELVGFGSSPRGFNLVILGLAAFVGHFVFDWWRGRRG
jgi:hypothetical protein